jgi:uncharacterized protein YndB with AHSA1/START domain
MATWLTVSAGVLVAAEQERVWDLAVDWAQQERWVLATKSEGGHGAGARVVGRTGFGPVSFTDPMLITRWDPPNRCVVAHEGKVVRGTGTFEVVPRSAAEAEFRWIERIEIPLPQALGKPLAVALIGPVTRVGLGWSLRRFARLVTARQPENQP